MADVFAKHVCAAWVDHTKQTANAFYRQVTDEHAARALPYPRQTLRPKAPAKAAQKTVQHASATPSDSEQVFPDG